MCVLTQWERERTGPARHVIFDQLFYPYRGDARVYGHGRDNTREYDTCEYIYVRLCCCYLTRR